MFDSDPSSSIVSHQLPDGFLSGKPAETLLHFYETNEPSIKNQVQLTQHLFCLLLQGQKTVHSSTTTHQIDAQSILLMPRGSVLMTEKTADSGTYRSILLFFSTAFLLDFSARHGYSTQGMKERNITAIVWEKDAFITNYIQSLELLKPATISPNMQQLKLEELLCYLFETYPETMQHFLAGVAQEQQHISLKQVVSANIDNNLTIEELAFLCNQSVSTFKRHFTEAYHTSPKKYFTEHRMRKAQQLLQLYQRPSDIYHRLGYENLSSFSAEFKKHTGRSPKQFQLELDPNSTILEPIA